MADIPASRRDSASSPTIASRQNPSSTHQTLSATNSATAPQRRQSGASQMAPPAPPPPQAQFHRFRLSEFQRAGAPLTGSPVGQCSRFRVSDFVQYGSAPTTGTDVHQHQQQPQPQPQLNGAASALQNPGPNASPRTTQLRPQPQPQSQQPTAAGSYSVLHMDIEAPPLQQTSNMVANTGGRGILHKVPMKVAPSAQFQNLQLPLNGQQPRLIVPAPAPMAVHPNMPLPGVKFEPSLYPEDVRWELARVLNNIQTDPIEFASLVMNAILTTPSFAENSLLRHIGALYPQLPPPPPPRAQPEADPEKPVKRKRGRPPIKNKPPATPNGAAAVPIAAVPVQPASAGPSNSMLPPMITVVPSRKDKDVMQTCTRCLKPFNPAWRPTPASDPSSEATCAVRHAYPDFASGLAVSLPTRKRNNYKPTWRWRCCGREIQSTSDELLMLPRKEDDKTGGWCFVGKHTTEPGVREKFGLKPGKGKTIDEVADISDTAAENIRKRAKLDDDVSIVNGSATPASTQRRASQSLEPSSQQQPQQQQQLQQQTWPQGDAYDQNPQVQSQRQPLPSPSMQPEPSQPEEPVKRKRGRPKGSKSKNKSIGITPATGVTAITPSAQTSPGSQLLAEASQTDHGTHNHLHVVNGGPVGNSFWTQYTEPHLPDLADGDAEHEEDDAPTQHVEAMGMSSVDLGMLVSATAAMGGQSGGLAPRPSVEPTPPVKRGRGRPKGVKNGAGKAALEKKRLEEEAARQQQQQQDQQRQVEAEPQSDPVVVPAGAGGGWFPGDDQGWGGFP